MNAGFYRDMFTSFEGYELDLSKIEVRVMVREDGETRFYATNGTVHVNVDKDKTGVFTIEAVPDE